MSLSKSNLIFRLSIIFTYFDRHISHLPQARGWEKKIADGPPCVVLASPGMLQPGPSRELLDLWAPDPRNGLIITGYSVDGTLARVSLSYSFSTSNDMFYLIQMMYILHSLIEFVSRFMLNLLFYE